MTVEEEPACGPVDHALEHVRARAAGEPLPAALRVTLNLHPDRLFRGRPLLRVHDEQDLKRVWHDVARVGRVTSAG